MTIPSHSENNETRPSSLELRNWLLFARAAAGISPPLPLQPAEVITRICAQVPGTTSRRSRQLQSYVALVLGRGFAGSACGRCASPTFLYPPPLPAAIFDIPLDAYDYPGFGCGRRQSRRGYFLLTCALPPDVPAVLLNTALTPPCAIRRRRPASRSSRALDCAARAYWCVPSSFKSCMSLREASIPVVLLFCPSEPARAADAPIVKRRPDVPTHPPSRRPLPAAPSLPR
ncbi:hypothetical protein C8J57DRAFT_1612515 [Mycena rebaudengoi]|nr:hypothetical protein C8J57DRAFT_1612515 [Mycena rebaudengoi]